MRWTWKDGTPHERANMVRSHKRFGAQVLRDLFALNDRGVAEILAGADWHPDYSTAEARMSRVAERAFGDSPYGGPGHKEAGTARDAARAVAGDAALLRHQVYQAILAAGRSGLSGGRSGGGVGSQRALGAPEIVRAGERRAAVD